MKFRKKPVVIEAMRLLKEDQSIRDCQQFVWNNPGQIYQTQRWDSGMIIVTLEGKMLASYGDWIIKGVNGEFYPCKPDIFEKTYEPIEQAHNGGA